MTALWFTRDDGETDVKLSYRVISRGCPPIVGGPPEACDPGEAPEFDIESVTLPDGTSVQLTDAEIARAEQVILDHILETENDMDIDWDDYHGI